MPHRAPRLLLLATTTGYQTRAFGEAAGRQGVALAFGTDRCDRLDDPWRDAAVPIRFHREDEAVAALVDAAAREPIDGILVVGDRPVVIAARLAAALGWPGHPPAAAAVSRDKRLTREALAGAGLPVPWFRTVPLDTDPVSLAGTVPYPCVVKPLALSGSRGVIRADDPATFEQAFERLGRLLRSTDVRALHDPALDFVQIEGFIPGQEYAVEALLDRGRLRVLAIFEKPDPLDGPFFEETIYVTPPRVMAAVTDAIESAVAAAARAIGLYHGPIHAECRVGAGGIFVLEVAARPIGGLCARALRFEAPGLSGPCSLEDLLVRHAIGQPTDGWRREAAAAGVMMIPIPRAGLYRGVDGADEAAAVDGIEAVVLSARPDQSLVPLPEGASYLGFIFARGGTTAAVEARLREAHGRLRVRIDPVLPVVR
ncbi:MAG: ATP-grasp domain-containing protein [Acidobacteriota bacterium]|nr:ATP-grasp domain-containing protein [Acidobacteriota bacterium]